MPDRRPSKKKQRSTTVVLDEPGTKPGIDRSADACIVILHPPGAEIGRRTALDRDFYVLGRDASADVTIDWESVSRHHAELKRDLRGRWAVHDLGSTNGTFVNERRVDQLALKDGDQIRFGDVVVKFLSSANVESLYHEEIYQMSVLDGLTGVHNKRFFEDFLERELASANRHSHPLTLVMIDLDHFKQVNDARGHLVGDEVLRAVADRIKPRIRREDLFARYGGEEFAAILTITGRDGGVRFAEHLREMVARQPFELESGAQEVTISLGVATLHDEPSATVDDLIRRADEALYRAKREGRNRVAVEPGRSDDRAG